MQVSRLRSYTSKDKPSVQPPRRFRQSDAPVWGVASAAPPPEAGGGDTALGSAQPVMAPQAMAQAPGDPPGGPPVNPPGGPPIDPPGGPPVDPGTPAPGRKLAGTGRPDRLEGTVGADRLEGRGANDALLGAAGDDDLVGGADNDDLDGGEGFDTAFFSGSVLDYAIERRGEAAARVNDNRPGRDGADDVRGVEQLAFHDRTVYLQAGVNNGPLGRPDAFTVRYNQALRIPVSRLVANDVDFDGDALTVTGVKRVRLENGIVIYQPPTEIQWALAEGNTIQHSFTYQASDGRGGITTQVAMVTILGPGASGSPSPEAGDPTGPPVEPPRPQDGGGGGTVPTEAATPEVQTAAAAPTQTQAMAAELQAEAAATYSLWSDATTPAVPSVTDTKSTQVGVKFRADSNGLITGLRFYKGPQNTGTHVGTLWTDTGTSLGTLTFANETASGWQAATFTTPVAIQAGTTYVASYLAPSGRWATTDNYFASAFPSGPLTALANSAGAGGNGVFASNASASTFPNRSGKGTNYWVDVVFQPAATSPNAPPVANPDAATTNENTPITLAVLANDSDPDNDPLTVTSLDLTGTLGTVSVNPDNTIAYNPGTAYRYLNAGQTATDTFGYTISDGRGGTATATATVTVTGLDNVSNKISLENSRPGNPQSEWGINGNGDPSIEGFATDMSVNAGGTVRFKVNTEAGAYRLDIYRFGYYGGLGARKVATVRPGVTRQRQPAPLTDPATGLVDAGNWAESAAWAVPGDATSGVYFAKLVREDGVAGSNHIYFVVRDDTGQSDLVFQTADTTWQAYNQWGGNSFYAGSPAGRAYKVSYNRPFGSASYHSVNRPVLDAEYPMIRWLEANGYDLSYISGIDTDRAGAELREHKGFLSVGHDEYWTGAQRANVEAARDAGVNLAFFSGNEIYWKSRWENSIDGSNQPYRTLATYKETWANAKIDPSPQWTGTWRDPRFSPPSDGGRPENRLTGTIFSVDSYRLDSLKVPAEDGRMRFWRGTSVAAQAPGQTATLNANVLGYEWDEDLDNGFRPPGAINLSSTTLDVAQYVSNHGNTVGPGTATHELTAYRPPGGGLVFGAGTTRWSWGLDAEHINEPSTPDPRMQQATVNLLADMKAQPTTLRPGLNAATASTDTAAPQSAITSPSAGTAIPAGSTVTITGTAGDAGGVVGGVEVSTDGGASWRAAKGRGSWSYSWQPASAGPRTLLSRATDDSLNIETPGAGVAVDVQEAAGPWSIWSAATTPAIVNVNDPNALEVGVKFQASRNGYITGIRFYKGSQNTGTHTGSLWSATGTRLATTTFANETASGWQQSNFTSPVAVTANTTYVASYFAPRGFYSANVDYFQSTGVGNGPIRALSSPEAGGNGVYAYGAASQFPTSTYRSANYWVDVVFSDSMVA